MQTHGIGRLYWHSLKYPVKPSVVIERAETQEIDEPFRSGHGWAIRLPFTRNAVVIGWWTHRLLESAALSVAIRGRYLEDDQVDWDFIRYGEQEVES